MGRENIRRPETNDFRKSYDLVIIGGGMVGPSLAFFLQKKLPNHFRVALLESHHNLGQGTSIASLEQGRCGWPDQAVCQMMMKSSDILKRPQDYGLKISKEQLGWVDRPYLWLASTDEEMKRFQQLAFVLKRRGVDAEYVDLNLAMELCPWLIGTSVRGGMLDRSGFKINTQGMAEAFAESTPNTQFFIDTPAYSILTKNGKVSGVKTSDGSIIKTERVIVAAGPATRGLVETVGGLSISTVSLARFSYYSKTRHPDIVENQPFVIVPVTGAYFRPDGKGILGGFSHTTPGVATPPTFFPEAYDQFKIQFLTAVWRGLNPKGLSDTDEIGDDPSADPLGFYTATQSKRAPFGDGTVSGGYYVHREKAPEDDRPMILWLSELGIAGLGVATAFSGHGAMGAPGGGLIGADIFSGNQKDDRQFGLNPPPSKGVSLTI
jgi:glycine/D-amino acid oxidase-like deaminating enzyme